MKEETITFLALLFFIMMIGSAGFFIGVFYEDSKGAEIKVEIMQDGDMIGGFHKRGPKSEEPNCFNLTGTIYDEGLEVCVSEN